MINHYAGSIHHGMEYRPYYLAREWVKEGHYVAIVGASFSHVRNIQPEVKEVITKEKIDGIDYFWIKTPKYKGNGFQRFINIIAFVLKLLFKGPSLAREIKPDVVIASSTYPIDIFPAKLIAIKRKARLIFEVHDLWPLSPLILGGMSKFNPFIVLMQIGENCAGKWADKVVSILPLAKEHFVAHRMKEEKFFHIPNGIVIDDWNQTEKIPEDHRIEIDKLKNEGKFLVCYAGAHGLANALESLVMAAKLVEDKKIHILLIGDGPLKKKLIECVKRNCITNVSFLPPVPKKSIPAVLESMDVLFFSLQKCSLFKYGISPNKLFDYMMAGKPIIQAVESGNDIVAEAGCGITVEPGNEIAYAEALVKLLNMTKDEREKIGLKGKDYILKKHDLKMLAKLFLEVLKE